MAPGKPKTARYTEIERKFAVSGSTVSPSFEGLSAVGEVVSSGVQQLDAVYFDTPDRDLAAHRITLRRRTGGSDAGWHLKLPAGPETRTEVRTPLGTATTTVPDDLRDIVLAIVRDRPLSPVARISTQRRLEVLHGTDGTALAEFCDDRVTASATGQEADQQSWREWELELLTADIPDDLMDRLSNRLADAGAAPAGHGSKLAKVLGTSQTSAQAPTPPADPVHRAIAEQIDQVLVWDRAVRADAYDSVHQMRVVTRKIRSLLQESKDSFELDDNGWVLDELRALAAVLGEARDAEVLAERYQRALDEMPAELVRGPVRQRLVEGANRRYTAGWRRSLLAMRSQRYFRLLDALEELISAEQPESAEGAHPSPVTINSAYKRVRKAAKTAAKVAADTSAEVTAEAKDEALHRIRKGAKRLRYTAAATGAVEVSERAKNIQTLLGDHQDSVVSKAHLSTQADAAYAAGEDTFTYGLLYQQEHDIAQHSRALLQDALKQLDKAVRKTH
ncbi:MULTISPECIES: CYTH and CHAD domain-containing protein [unclassified Mycolicibacterium]|uniref:CYTH and CHAD domain-containing protein n=1 Tax=unclassified Mycolicibacterium TaxID=2636767 RepID=UPI0012DF4359|nr:MULTISPECIES: CYTH and CHAD domain-containing protein [unclassified Mycolicibacterium]MUL82354.1 CYTH and CHAD domain-containing protein [Mycolicibacterium sp. CBMA 329]MUL91514.1 CYTH and CHAD domain-containing protein [Mycolicibacterium sp. CBMA 331]MUM02992.1 CYTH and CHAD domain-containing protein [Mycolicibacterium sp. CBMA 334]MUM28533.1 CYTH and CHAD domain-containing protein [Mycolicibacterium sp. CBMA 295]MUM41938.1 CYTH and CHAD domain-containing protein [Mycolicibacterium sp. CBM